MTKPTPRADALVIPPTVRIAEHIDFNTETGRITINGDTFDWAIEDGSVSIRPMRRSRLRGFYGFSGSDPHLVTITLMAERVTISDDKAEATN